MIVEEVQERIWVSNRIPTRQWSRAKVRYIWNANQTPNPDPPTEAVGNASLPWELYYHHSIVDELKKKIAQMQAAMMPG